MKQAEIILKGIVQGVGFRPFVKRTALKFGLYGFVENREFGVRIIAVGDNEPILDFIYAPALGDLYWGIKNSGAFKNGQRIFNNSNRNELVGTHSRFHSNPATADFFTKNNISIINANQELKIRCMKLADNFPKTWTKSPLIDLTLLAL